MEFSANRRLIFDLGVHRGEDTEFYIKKGFKVVGVEASRSLVEQCRKYFAGEIRNGSLKLYESAIYHIDDVEVSFYENQTKAVWNTMDKDWVKRNEKFGTISIETKVKTITLSKLIKNEGIPYYIKIDIEGMDSVAIQSLQSIDERPVFLSAEADFTSWNKLFNQLKLLRNLGYNRFKIIDQGKIHYQKCPRPAIEGEDVEHLFKSGSSGLFGEELPGNWLSFNHAVIVYYFLWINFSFLTSSFFLIRIVRRMLKKARLLRKKTWYDTHAKFRSNA